MRTRAIASRAPSRRATALLLLSGGATLTALAAWLIVARQPRLGGLAAAGAGVLLLTGSAVAARDGRLAGFVASVTDRAFDGLVLSAIAWTERTGDPAASAGALVALAASFLAAYVRARGQSLAYVVEEGAPARALRYGLVSAGLLTGWVAGAVWTTAALAALTAAIRALQVAKEEQA